VEAMVVMIESWLLRLDSCADTIIASAILSDRRVTSDTQLGEVFLAPRLAAGSPRLAPTLSPLTSSKRTSSDFRRKSSIFGSASNGSLCCFGSLSC